MIIAIDIQDFFLKEVKNNQQYIEKINNFLINTNDSFGIIYDNNSEKDQDIHCLNPVLSIKSPSFIISKSFGFILGDWKRYSDEEIVEIGKFILNNKLIYKNYQEAYDLRGLFSSDNKIILHRFKQMYPHYSDLINRGFLIPFDLVDYFQQINNQSIILIGGRLSSCVREINLVLKIMEINCQIIDELCYD